VVKVVCYGTFLGESGRSSYMGSGKVGWDGMMVSCSGDGACGGDGAFSVMMVV
jgi:hypothetical protein